MDRRTWFQLIGVLAAARTAWPNRRAAPATPQKISKDQVAAALTLLGLEFTGAQIDMLLPDVNRSLAGYEALRKVDVPLDTEPAFSFHPGLGGAAGRQGPRAVPSARWGSRRRRRPGRAPKTSPSCTVTELAPLVRARRVSSTEITRMYLERLKKHAPALNCVITLTEDLALRAGRRRRQRDPRGASIAGRCTASPGAPRTCSPPRASPPPGAPSRSASRSSTTTPRWWSGCATRARCWWPSCRWARWRKAGCGSAG